MSTFLILIGGGFLMLCIWAPLLLLIWLEYRPAKPPVHGTGGANG